LRGPTSKGGEEGKGEGGEGRGGEAFLVMWPRRLSALNPPLITTLCIALSSSLCPPALYTLVAEYWKY